MAVLPPKPDIDWAHLGFQVRPTNFYVEYTYEEGVGWNSGRLVKGDTPLVLPTLASCLHYGQTCFEGLKAFRMADGQVRLFRADAHAERFQTSCDAVSLPAPPVNLFMEACVRAVQSNLDLVPPFEHLNASLYVRPFAFGCAPQIGLHPAAVVKFLVTVLPVGGYYQTDGEGSCMGAPVKALIMADYDRAAPHGCGRVKVGGNYGATLGPSEYSKKHGYSCNLFLDPKRGEFIEEFNSSNFVGIKFDDKLRSHIYVTPLSGSVLPSVTNRSLAYIAKSKFGWEVQHRPVRFSELSDGEFGEVAACGTAVILTPIAQVDREAEYEPTTQAKVLPNEALYSVHQEFERNVYAKLLKPDVGPPKIAQSVSVGSSTSSRQFQCLERLYNALVSIQRGTDPNWKDYDFHSNPIVASTDGMAS